MTLQELRKLLDEKLPAPHTAAEWNYAASRPFRLFDELPVLLARVEKVVAEMRGRELKVPAFESAATASQVGFWADELEGK